jgi:hypothetical protein
LKYGGLCEADADVAGGLPWSEGEGALDERDVVGGCGVRKKKRCAQGKQKLRAHHADSGEHEAGLSRIRRLRVIRSIGLRSS